MAQEIFKRYEKKYLLTGEQYQNLMLVLGGVLEMDCYGEHTICNIYLDTADYQLIRASIEKPVYKEKVRLRSYGRAAGEDSTVFVELKKKFESVVYKRRMEMTLEEARKYLYYGIEPKCRGQVYWEVDYTVKRYGLKPMAYISYERCAYTCVWDQELRVTFDKHILGRSGELDLRAEAYGKELLEEGQVLMEVKMPGAIPLWLSKLFGELEIYSTSYSKYGTFYKKYGYPMMMAGLNGTESRGWFYPQSGKGGYICA